MPKRKSIPAMAAERNRVVIPAVVKSLMMAEKIPAAILVAAERRPIPVKIPERIPRRKKNWTK